MKACHTAACEAGYASGLKTMAWSDVFALMTYTTVIVAFLAEMSVDDALNG